MLEWTRESLAEGNEEPLRCLRSAARGVKDALAMDPSAARCDFFLLCVLFVTLFSSWLSFFFIFSLLSLQPGPALLPGGQRVPPCVAVESSTLGGGGVVH